MANYGVVILNDVRATNVNALNRNVKAVVDVENGSVLKLGALSGVSGEGEVFIAGTPASGNLTGLYMAYTPEIVSVVSATGKKFRGLTSDPREFYNVSGEVFNAFKPEIGDIITISTDGIGGTKSSNTFIVATDGQLKLQWASAAVSGLSLKLLATTYVTIADGSIGNNTGRTTAYQFEVVAV